MKKVKVYIIANIHPSRHNYIEKVCSKLNSDFELFKPHVDNEYNLNNSKIEFGAFYKDKVEMDKAEISLVIMPLFGRDCACEIGYSRGIGNCVIAWVDKMESKQEQDWLNDWMVKGFIDYIITPNKKSYKLLSNNPLILEKQQFEKQFGKKKVVYFLNFWQDLSEMISQILIERKNLKRCKE